MNRVIPVEGETHLLSAMAQCEQTKDMSVQQHGQMVATYYEDLIDHLEDGDELAYEWRLPAWTYRSDILEGLPSRPRSNVSQPACPESSAS